MLYKKKRTVTKRVLVHSIGIFFVFLISLPDNLFGGVFKHLTIRDGLSQNTANCTIQTQDGLIYFGTQKGLNEYDGYGFTTYLADPDNPHALLESDIHTLFIDSSGTLWAGTASALHRFDSKLRRFDRYLVDLKELRAPSLSRIQSVAEDKNGRLWLSISGLCGLGMFDPNGAGKIQYIKDLSEKKMRGDACEKTSNIIIDEQERIWFGTKYGIERYSIKTGTFHLLQLGDKKNIKRNITYLYQEDTNKVWVGSNNGLYVIDNSGKILSHFVHDVRYFNSLSDNRVTCILKDSQGNLWVTTRNGLNLYSPKNKDFTKKYNDPLRPFGLSSSNTQYIFEDRNKLLWISTGQGVDIYSSHQEAAYLANKGGISGVEGDVIWSILPSKKESSILWLSSDKGLFKYDLISKTILKHYNKDAFPGEWIFNIFEDQNGLIWLGTQEDGVIRLNPDNDEIVVFSHDPDDSRSIASYCVKSILQDKDGNIWYAGLNGLSRFNPKDESFVRYGEEQGVPELENLGIDVFFQSKDGIFWLGSRQGLYQFNPLTNEIHYYTYDSKNHASLSANSIQSIYEDYKGQIWVGTSMGLNRWINGTNRFKRIPLQSYVTSTDVFCILEDQENNLLFSSNPGLKFYNPVERTTDDLIPLQDLPVYDFAINSCAIVGEDIYFGGAGGAIYFPVNFRGLNESINVQRTPRTMLRKVFINNILKKISPKQSESTLSTHISQMTELQLTHQDKVVTFEFAADDYNDSSKNEFMHRLKGFDADWIKVPAGEHSATYSNLPSGKYEFWVKAALPNGVFGEITSIKLDVVPPPWETVWAYIAYCFAGGGILMSIGWQRYQRIKEERNAQVAIAKSEREYSNFVENSTEGIWHAEFETPIPTDLPLEEQVRQILSSLYLVKANKSLAKMYGFTVKELISESYILFKYTEARNDLTEWINGNYQSPKQIFCYHSETAKEMWCKRAYTGEVVDGKLVAIWGVQRDISENYRNYEIINYQATHDTLTGLYNREWFYQEVKKILQDKGENIALFIFDAHNIKQITDNLGHDFSDVLLKMLAKRLKESFGTLNILTRMIGGEFTFIHFCEEDESEENLQSTINLLLHTFDYPFVINDVKIKIISSIGIVLSQDYGRDIDELMRCANVAMQVSKNQKLPFSFFQPTEETNSGYRLGLLADLLEAMSTNKLELYYQAKMDLKTQKVFGFEALLRWNHPRYGHISPGVFIPIIEGTAHIHTLTSWIIEQSFKQWAILHQQGYLVSIAINLTVYNFYAPDFIPQLTQYVRKYNIEPSYIEFEITENSLMEDVDHVFLVMKQMRDLGFNLAIDDFGTGYSSLVYLKDLPLDTLKIDMHFIKTILEDEKNLSLVQWIIQLSHLYDLKVVAEGIESQEVLDKLSSLGCDYGQGFYISHPLPPNKIDFLQLCG